MVTYVFSAVVEGERRVIVALTVNAYEMSAEQALRILLPLGVTLDVIFGQECALEVFNV